MMGDLTKDNLKMSSLRICEYCFFKVIHYSCNYFCKIRNCYVLWNDTCKDWKDKDSEGRGE